MAQRLTGNVCETTKKNGGRSCRGKLKDTILDWEADLPEVDAAAAEEHSKMADLSLTLGTSLQIVPAGTFPTYVKRRKKNMENCKKTKEGEGGGDIGDGCGEGGGSVLTDASRNELMDESTTQLVDSGADGVVDGSAHDAGTDKCCDISANGNGDDVKDTSDKQPLEEGKLVIVSLSKTKHDKKADLRIYAKVDDVMRGLMSRLDLDIPEREIVIPILESKQPLEDKKGRVHSVVRFNSSIGKLEMKEEKKIITDEKVIKANMSEITVEKKKNLVDDVIDENGIESKRFKIE